MHIILVSDRLATTKTVTLTGRHMALAGMTLAVLLLVLAGLISYVSVRHAAEVRLPILQDLVRAIGAEESERRKQFLRENLNAMAVRLGEMQAQLMRLDSLGERLAALAGVKRGDAKPVEASKGQPAGGRGGPLVAPSALSPEDLQRAMDELSRQVDAKNDMLSLLEIQLLEERIKKSLLPTTLPVAVQWNASAFGFRIDPFTGERAMHEGVDFSAEPGTPIVAAAAGIVITAERHPEYGYMVEIDHGNNLTTRYAHASRNVVKEGALVKRGQKIAEVGSTGRSTGPHLHFEVRIRGVAQNPNRFLEQARAGGTRVARR